MATFCLLVFGPIVSLGKVWPLAMFGIPIALWLIFKYWGSKWDLDDVDNDRINRAIFGAAAGALLVGASLEYTSKYHLECDQSVQTRDGRECVGEEVPVKGGDVEAAFLLVVLAGFAFWRATCRPLDG